LISARFRRGWLNLWTLALKRQAIGDAAFL
jgi:hypothetical protein